MFIIFIFLFSADGQWSNYSTLTCNLPCGLPLGGYGSRNTRTCVYSDPKCKGKTCTGQTVQDKGCPTGLTGNADCLGKLEH